MQDEVNQDYSEQNEVDGMKKGADFACSKKLFQHNTSYNIKCHKLKLKSIKSHHHTH